MKFRTVFAPLAAAVLAMSPTVATAQVPGTISYQAYLTDDNGSPLAAGAPENFDIEFRLFSAAQDGAAVWAESQTVSLFEGNFSTLLGAGDEISGQPRPPLADAFDDAERYLEITIIDGGGTRKTFSPRQQLVAAPFAFKAKLAESAAVADTVTNSAITTDMIAPGAVDGTKLKSRSIGSLNLMIGAVTTNNLVNNAISTAKINNRAVTGEKIANNAIGPLHIADDAVGSSQIANNAVGASEIASNAVGTSEIANDAVTIDKLADAIARRLVPAGTVVAWINRAGGPGVPDGWLLCNGANVSKATYPELFSAIATLYGDAGANFVLPNFNGKLLVGFNSSQSIPLEPAQAASNGSSGIGYHAVQWIIKAH